MCGIVAVDETYIGGKEGNEHANTQLHGTVGKFSVAGLRERDTGPIIV
ncbi:MAG: transposase [Chloroflexi bacterium]|nr:transposase [Chloroflexota bacterium]